MGVCYGRLTKGGSSVRAQVSPKKGLLCAGPTGKKGVLGAGGGGGYSHK